MHKGEDNASSSEDGNEQMNFNLLLAQINLMISSELGLLRWTSNNLCFNADPL